MSVFHLDVTNFEFANKAVNSSKSLNKYLRISLKFIKREPENLSRKNVFRDFVKQYDKVFTDKVNFIYIKSMVYFPYNLMVFY